MEADVLDIDHSHYAAVKTGDIMLFASWSVTSLITKVATYSNWTHAGIAVWMETGEGRSLYVFEAGTDNEYDILSSNKGSGCRLVNMDQIRMRYSKIGFRPIRHSRTGDFYDRLRDFMMRWKGTPFRPLRRLALLNSGLSNKVPTDDGTIFCSELAAKWLEECGVVAPNHYPHFKVVPETFAHDDIFPTSCFAGPVRVMYDTGIDEPMKVWLVAIVMACLFLYILLTIDDEVRYRGGHRRRKKNRA